MDPRFQPPQVQPPQVQPQPVAPPAGSWTRTDDDRQPILTYERPIGDDQFIVLFFSRDTGMQIDVGILYWTVAEDAARRAADGWRIVSTSMVPMHQAGTAGNIVFQAGGQYTTQVAVAVIYARR